MRRFLFYCILLVGFPVAPWWLLLILVLAGLILFRNFWEGIAYIFIYDLCFGLPDGGLLYSQFTLTVLVIVAYLLVEAFRDRLRFSAQ